MEHLDIDEAEIKRLALKYLSGNRLMTVATSIVDRPWAATVFFAYDDDFNLVFMSKRDTRHSHNIKMNDKVAVAINQDWGVPGLVKGIQIFGYAKVIRGKKYERLIDLFKQRFPWHKKYPDHSYYLIEPEEVYYIDHKQFGHFHRIQVL